MKRFLSWLIVIIALIGGSARFVPDFPPLRWLWQVQLVCGEFGLLLAIPLVLIAFSGSLKKPKAHTLAAASGIALTLSLLPMMELLSQERNWIWDLRYSHQAAPIPEIGFPNPYGADAEPLFQFQDLFRLPEFMSPTVENFDTPDGARLPIYIYRPTGETALNTPLKPWILSIHGGGWDSGNADDLDSLYGAFLRAGYTVIAPDYRFAPTYRWPKQLEDIETSYKWIQTHSDRLGIDKTKFWLFGRSAGGQIALKFGYNLSMPPKGVISLYAPTDLDFGFRWSRLRDVINSRELMKALTGGTPDTNAVEYADASPLNDIKSDSPPTLLIYGKSDPLVWYRHGVRLHQRLLTNGIRSTLIELPWATHGFDYFPNSPGGQITANSVLRFMRETRD